MPAMIIASSGAKNANKAKTKHHKEKYADDGEVRGRRRFVRARGGRACPPAGASRGRAPSAARALWPDSLRSKLSLPRARARRAGARLRVVSRARAFSPAPARAREQDDEASGFPLSDGTMDDMLSRMDAELDRYRDPSKWSSPAARAYINLANRAQFFVYVREEFNYFIIGCIFVAAALIGMQTYAALERSDGVKLVDGLVLGVFCFEVVIKIISEALAPWRYWTGGEWKWNNFDFWIVLLSLPVPGMPEMDLALLRLVRLARLAKLVKKIPALQTIIMGLVGGLKSICYILLLLMLLFYLYGIMGFFFFGANDVFHFGAPSALSPRPLSLLPRRGRARARVGDRRERARAPRAPRAAGSLPAAIVTLFRASTLEDWTDIMYISVFGCGANPYGNTFFVSERDERPEIYRHLPWAEKGIGKRIFSGRAPTDLLREGEQRHHCVLPNLDCAVFYCDRAQAPDAGTSAFAAAYWISFTIISALVMLSLFIGAVTMSMTESMDEMKEEQKEDQRLRCLEKKKKKMASESGEGGDGPITSRPSAVQELVRKTVACLTAAGEAIDAWRQRVGLTDSTEEIENTQAMMRKLLLEAWDGTSAEDADDADAAARAEAEKNDDRSLVVRKFWAFVALNKRIAESSEFNNSITIVILLAGVLVGIQTIPQLADFNLKHCEMGGENDEFVMNPPNLNTQSLCGAETDHEYRVVRKSEAQKITTDIFNIVNLLILVIFTIECAIKMIGDIPKPLRYVFARARVRAPLGRARGATQV